jgi:hypothetical protein
MTILLSFLPFVAGCGDDCNECPGPVADNAPPFPPDGVFSVTGDEMVTIYWNDNWEEDLAGYAVYRNNDGSDVYGWVTDVPANQTYYFDYDVNNGETWYYAVLAFDRAGNESDLSYEDVFDTPRPEGSGLVLMDYLGQSADQSGWDFDLFSRQKSDSITTDIYFGVEGGVRYIITNTGVDIQDYGLIDLINVDWAPETGWSDAGRAEAIAGHSYIIRINSAQGWNMAKIEVLSVSNTSVTLAWAYQEVNRSLELAPGGGTAQ